MNQGLDRQLVRDYGVAAAAYLKEADSQGDVTEVELVVESLAGFSLWDAINATVENCATARGGKTVPPGTRALAVLAIDPDAVDDADSAICKQLSNWLSANLESLFTRGGAGRALRWLRFLEWREGRGGADVDNVLQSAYKYMKNVDRPSDFTH